MVEGENQDKVTDYANQLVEHVTKAQAIKTTDT
jgi:hypothetical protein